MDNNRTEYCLTIEVRDKFSNCKPKTMSIRGFFSEDEVDLFVRKIWRKYDLVDKVVTEYGCQQSYDAQSPEKALIVLKLNPND